MDDVGMSDEEMALNLGRSCRIASIERQMDELWGLFLMRPSRLNSNDYLWMKGIESLAQLILQMDRDQQFAQSVVTRTESANPGTTGSASPTENLLSSITSSVRYCTNTSDADTSTSTDRADNSRS